MDIVERSPTFCVLPWVHLATNSSGNYRVCCNSTPGKNQIMSSDGQPLKINKVSPQQAWNSPTYIKLREEFLAGKRPGICERCFREEDTGVESARIKWNRRWHSEHESEVSPPLDIKYLDLRLGNLCNLKCRMCNPYASSKWVDEWNAVAETARLVPPNALSDSEVARLKKISWPDEQSTWDHMEEILPTIEEVYLTGGEPFLSLKQVDFLKHLISEGRSQDIIVKYNTNLGTLPLKLAEVWACFKEVKLNVSVDGYGELNDYIRHPAKWSDIDRHLDKLLEMKTSGAPLTINIHTTVQSYNVFDLGALIDFSLQKIGSSPYLNILNHPYCLNIQSLPLALKHEVRDRLSAHSFASRVDDTIKYMLAEERFTTEWPAFVRYTNKLDELRKQSVFSFRPEFREYFEFS
jgi:organic radical activating enzyme